MIIPSTALRYVFSGIAASAVMFGSLLVFREFFGIWYLFSSTLAFIFAFVTSFVLQKFWTFAHRGTADSPMQLVLFFTASLVNLGLNGLGMFVLVEKVGVWYLLAQVLVTACIATWSFFIYRFIFRPCAE